MISHFAGCDIKFFEDHGPSQWFRGHILQKHFHYLYGDDGPHALIEEENDTRKAYDAYEKMEDFGLFRILKQLINGKKKTKDVVNFFHSADKKKEKEAKKQEATEDHCSN